MKVAALLSLTLLISLPVSAAHAGKPKKMPDYMQKRIEKRAEEMRLLDENGDGLLQVKELQKSANGKFEAADADRDGILTQKEISATLKQLYELKRETLSKATTQKQVNRLKNLYKKADEDENDRVTAIEFTTYMNNRYGRFDRDGNGIITVEEFRADGEKLPDAYRRDPVKKSK